MAKLPVDNRELYVEIKLSKGQGHLTAKAQQLFIVLARNIIRKKQYYDEDDRGDCLQTAMLALFANWQGFNAEKFSNAFAYFTEVCKRGLAQGFNELHGHRGEDKDYKVHTVSISSANKGEGMFSL
jgi:hypothetical protein